MKTFQVDCQKKFFSFEIWFQEGFECAQHLVLLQLESHHGDDEEESNPRDGRDEAHVHFELHEAPAAGQDRAKG